MTCQLYVMYNCLRYTITMSGPETEHMKLEAFLSNKAFNRFADGLLLYQRLIFEAPGQEERNSIIHRMRLLYPLEGKPEESARLTEQVLSSCEANTLTKEGIAKILSESSYGEKILASWNPESGYQETERGRVYTNEVIAYEVTQKNHLSIHVVPTPINGKDIPSKIAEGIRIIAQEIREGNLQTIQQVDMESWLFFYEPYKPLVQTFLQKAIGEVREVEPSNEAEERTVAEIQHLALQFNRPSLQKYLLTGEKPKVGILNLTKEKFLELVESVTS